MKTLKDIQKQIAAKESIKNQVLFARENCFEIKKEILKKIIKEFNQSKQHKNILFQ